MYRLIKSHKAIYVDHFVEYDSLKRPHIHGTFMARRGLLLSRFKEPYHTVHLDFLKTQNDQDNWYRYIRKEQYESIKEELNQILGSDYPFIN